MRILGVVDQLTRDVAGGIGTYTAASVSAISRLVNDDREVSVTLYASRLKRAKKSLGLGLPTTFAPLPQPIAQRLWDRHLLNPSTSAELIHSFSMAGPRPRGRKQVVKLSYCVYDLLWEKYPEAFPRRGREWHSQALRFIIDNADGVVTISERSRCDLILKGLDDSRIEVIPPGADHLAAPDCDGAERLLSELGLTQPYLISFGTLEPRKNLGRVVEAFQEARSELSESWELLIVGPIGWGSQLASTKGVFQSGEVSDGVLSALVSQALLTLYVPWDEGFGLPVLEANKLGCPVVSSDIPAAQDAAMIADPYDVSSIGGAIVSVLSDDALYSQLIAQGRRVATGKTWENNALAHLRFFQKILTSSRG